MSDMELHWQLVINLIAQVLMLVNESRFDLGKGLTLRLLSY
jgi:hypothetical protein